MWPRFPDTKLLFRSNLNSEKWKGGTSQGKPMFCIPDMEYRQAKSKGGISRSTGSGPEFNLGAIPP